MTARPAEARAYLEDGLRSVSCHACDAQVTVRKYSLQHTSVQWTSEAVRSCAEFAARTASGEQTALIATCLSLRDSIDAAVAEGRLEVAG